MRTPKHLAPMSTETRDAEIDAYWRPTLRLAIERLAPGRHRAS